MTDSFLNPVHRLSEIANDVHCDDSRLYCVSGCEASMIVWSGAASEIVYEESGRAGRNCQFRMT
jgi:hypothetical protein